MEALRKAHELRPELADASFNLAMAYFLAGKQQDARLAIEDCLKAKPDHPMANDFKKAQGW
jgi:Flp pilus assembly protein TadD